MLLAFIEEYRKEHDNQEPVKTICCCCSSKILEEEELKKTV